MKERTIKATVVTGDDGCYYMRLVAAKGPLGPAKLRLSARTETEAKEQVRKLGAILDALEDYSTGKPAPYSLPLDLEYFAEEMPAIARWAAAGLPALLSHVQNN
jgi:hypothetical protein